MVIQQLIRISVLAFFTLFCIKASAQSVGTIASVNPQLLANNEAVNVGFDLAVNDIVQTNKNGRGQILFKDQTTLTVAPNSNIMLDKFVYDPDSKTGEIGLNLTKGALRFVGGNITKKTPAIIKTPAGVIGLRGGIALIISGPDGVRAVFLAGEQMCISVGDTQSCTSRRGGILTQNGYQGEASEEELASLIALIDGPMLADTDQLDTIMSGFSELFSPFDDDISTTGESRTIVIIEDNIDELVRNPPVREQQNNEVIPN